MDYDCVYVISFLCCIFVEALYAKLASGGEKYNFTYELKRGRRG
jgi:hypothetical protein